MKAEKRTLLGLPPLPEDSIKVIRNMRAASPPASASDLIEQQQKRGRREHKVSDRSLQLPRFSAHSGLVPGQARLGMASERWSEEGLQAGTLSPVQVPAYTGHSGRD